VPRFSQAYPEQSLFCKASPTHWWIRSKFALAASWASRVQKVQPTTGAERMTDNLSPCWLSSHMSWACPDTPHCHAVCVLSLRLLKCIFVSLVAWTLLGSVLKDIQRESPCTMKKIRYASPEAMWALAPDLPWHHRQQIPDYADHVRVLRFGRLHASIVLVCVYATSDAVVLWVIGKQYFSIFSSILKAASIMTRPEAWATSRSRYHGLVLWKRHCAKYG